MKNFVRRNLLLVTHGVAILAGSLVGTLLFRDSTSIMATHQHGAKPVRSSAPDLSSVWLDQSLRKIREEESKSETPSQAPPTMAEFLKKCREDAAAEQKEYAERLDEIVKKSAKYANEPDPLAAIRRNMRAGNWEDDHSLEILQA